MEVASGKVYAGKVIEKSRLTKPHAKQKVHFSFFVETDH
jgi:hypothetical protein